MIKLNAIRSDKVWGYELWIASTHANGCQKEFKDFVGGDFPLLVKLIQADKRLSVQVHPDNERASLYEHCRGKTECWYILSAQPGAQIVYGLNGVYTDRELRNAIEANSLEDCLRYVPVEAGDFVYIPAGTVHALCGGVRLLEVQQSSDITYRLYDWGRDRELHVEKGIACIKNDGVRNVSLFPGAFSCPYFELEEITVEKEYVLSAGKSGKEKKPSDYVLYYVIEGEGTINGESCGKEDIFVLAPEESALVSGNLRIMKIISW